MIFLTNSTNYFFHTQEAIIQDIDLQMLNPTYPEGREVFSLVQLGNYSAENMTFSGTGFMNYSGYQKFKQKVSSSGECLVDYKLQVTFSDPSKQCTLLTASPSYENCNINFQVVSQSPASCSVDFQVNYTLDTTVTSGYHTVELSTASHFLLSLREHRVRYPVHLCYQAL
jgi:hypothetical protein